MHKHTKIPLKLTDTQYRKTSSLTLILIKDSLRIENSQVQFLIQYSIFCYFLFLRFGGWRKLLL